MNQHRRAINRPRFPSDPTCTPGDAGFSLIEVLVAIMVIGILTALLLPAVQRAREASRRAACISNLRQIGQALHAYHDAQGCLPPGRYRTTDPRQLIPGIPCSGPVDRSFLVAILPQLDLAPLYNSINSQTWILDRENSTARSTSVATYVCPSDPRAFGSTAVSPLDRADDPQGLQSNDRAARTSYGAFFGTVYGFGLPHYASECQQNPASRYWSNGCFNDVHPITWASVRDGLSQTLILADKSVTQLSRYHHPDYPRVQDDMGWWVHAQMGHAEIDASHPPNAYKRAHFRNLAAWLWTAASLHNGGVNGLMADGSVHFFTDSIDAAPLLPDGTSSQAGSISGLWQKLVTRNGGEAINWQD